MLNNKNNRISPANIIAVVSIAALGVITFFGALFLSEDGQLGGAVIKAALFTFGIGLLLVFCIVTKTVESEFRKWRVLEYICLAAYLVLAVLCYKPFLQFFHVVQHKKSLQTMALAEIKEIDKLVDGYNSQAEDSMYDAARNLKQYIQNRNGEFGADEDGGLSKYVFDHKITNLKDWREDYDPIVHFDQESLDSLKQRIEIWNLMELSSIAYELEDKASQTWDRLKKHIDNFGSEFELIPVVSRGSANDPYRYEGLAKFDIGDRPASSEFTKKFREPVSGFNIGIVIYILLHVLAFFNYFLFRRSPVLEIRTQNQNDDSGLPLDVKE